MLLSVEIEAKMLIFGMVLLSLVTGLLLGPILGEAAEEQSYDPNLVRLARRDAQIGKNRLVHTVKSVQRRSKEAVAHLN